MKPQQQSLAYIKTKLNPSYGVKAMEREKFLSVKKLISGEYQVVTVVAPAGYGKSTLLFQWQKILQQQSIQCGWLSLDIDDNIQTRFLEYLIAALQHISPALGRKSQEMLQAGNIVNVKPLFDELYNELWDLDKESVLFIDDVQCITSPEILSLLSHLLERLPPTICFVFAGRAQPNLGLSKLRLQHRLLEYTAEEIRFNRKEIEQFICEFKNLSLDKVALDALYERTEGWVAALQMSSLILKKENGNSNFINGLTGKNKNITDYLCEVVLSKQNSVINDFLLKTSILDQMNAELCEVVTGMKNCQQLLEKIESSNLFLIPLDEERQWYRYHHLFAEFLQHQLTVKNNEIITEIYLKAITWCCQLKLQDQAIHYAVKSKQYDKAGQLLSANAMEIMQSKGDTGNLIYWIKQLPQNILTKYPFIHIAYIMSLCFHSQFEQAEYQTDILVKELSENNPQFKLIKSYAIISYGMVNIFTGNPVKVKNFISNNQQSLEINNPMIMLGIKMLEASICLYTYHFKKGGKIFQLTSETLKKANMHYTYAKNGSTSACLYVMQGNFCKAKNILDQTIDFVRPALPDNHNGVLSMNFVYGEILYEQSEIQRAEELCKSSITTLKQFFPYIGQYRFYKTMVRIHLAKGNIKNALNILEDDRYINKNWFFIKLLLIHEYIRFYLNIDDIEQANAFMHDYNISINSINELISDKIVKVLAKRLFNLIELRFLLAHKQYDEALIIINSLLNILQKHECKNEVIRLLIIRSNAYYKKNNKQQALDDLSEAMTLGQTDSYIQVFVEEGQAIRPLITTLYDVSKKQESKHGMQDYIKKILNQFDYQADLVTQNQIVSVNNTKKVLFSRRELSILRLLNSELTHQQLAGQLNIATSTLRWNLHYIYKKLSANSRNGAVVKAQSLNII